MVDSGAILKVDALVTGYGKKRVVNGVTLNVTAGEIVALIGHNGAGKSTLLKSIFGLLPVWQGQIKLDDKSIQGQRPRAMLDAGVVYIPQGNCVFTALTVRENLEIGGAILQNKTLLNNRIEFILSLFPILKDRLNQNATNLSGGEKQMLALASALILSPRLLLLDEPSLGLAPPLVSELFGYIRKNSLDSGASVLIVEQKVREVLKIANRANVLRNGVITFSGLPSALNESMLRDVFL